MASSHVSVEKQQELKARNTRMFEELNNHLNEKNLICSKKLSQMTSSTSSSSSLVSSNRSPDCQLADINSIDEIVQEQSQLDLSLTAIQHKQKQEDQISVISEDSQSSSGRSFSPSLEVVNIGHQLDTFNQREHISSRRQIYKQERKQQQHDTSDDSSQLNQAINQQHQQQQHNEHVKHVDLFGHKIVALAINDRDRLCLAQISNTLLKDFSYNEIHNRRVALGITCVQCTPIQLELLRRAGAMPSSSRRCGMITMREAERLCRSFLAEEQPPELPENFHFSVAHRVNYGCKGRFIPARYISSRAKCIECFYCGEFYSPNKFIFHSHKQPFATDCHPPDSPNINSWRKHIDLDWTQEHGQDIRYAWEDVKSLFNGGTRRRMPAATNASSSANAGSESANNNNNDDDEHSTTIDTAQRADNSTAKIAAVSKHNKQTKQQQSMRVDQSHQNYDADEDYADPNNSALLTKMPTLSVSERRKMPIGWPHQQQLAHLQLKHQMKSVANHQAATKQQTNAKEAANNACSLASKRQLSINNQQRTKRFQSINNIQRKCFQSHVKSQASSQSDHHHHHHHHHQLQGSQQFSSHNHLSPESQASSINNHHQQSSLDSDMEDHLMFASSRLQQGPSSVTHNLSCGLGVNAASSTSKLQAASIGSQFNYDQKLQQQQQQQTSSPAANFIYNQLYSQLIQSQQNQQLRPQQTYLSAALDPQLAIRHQIWSSLLANLQSQSASQTTLQTGTSATSNPALGLLIQNASHQTNPALQAYNLQASLPSLTTANQQQQTTNTLGETTNSVGSNNFNALNHFPVQMYPPQAVERIFDTEDPIIK